MVLALAILVGLGLRIALGKELRGWAQIPIRGEAPFVIAFVLCLVLPLAARVARLPALAISLPWCALMLAVVILSLLNFSAIRGFALLAIGSALNLLVIALNSVMPVATTAAAAVAGTSGAAAALKGDTFHRAMSSATHLSLLADILPLSGARPLSAVLSIGDVLMYVGIAVVICAARLPNNR